MEPSIQNEDIRKLENQKIFNQNLYAFLIYFVSGLIFLSIDSYIYKILAPIIVIFCFAVHVVLLVIFSIVSAIRKTGLGDKYFGVAFLVFIIGIVMLFFFYMHMAEDFSGIGPQ